MRPAGNDSYGHAMSISGTGSHRPDRRSGGGRPRHWMRVQAATYLLLAAVAVFQWLSADDSGGRWRAAVLLFLAVGVALGYASMARKKDDGEDQG
jgi:hypothetical protein